MSGRRYYLEWADPDHPGCSPKLVGTVDRYGRVYTLSGAPSEPTRRNGKPSTAHRRRLAARACVPPGG